MELTREQIDHVRMGAAVRLTPPEIGTECVLLRAHLYDRVRSLIEGDGLDQAEVGALVEATMREYDADDPLLESYQKYRT